MAVLQDITTYKAQATTLNFTMSPVTDITGWTIVFTLKQAITDASAVLTLSATIVSAAAGTFKVVMTKAHLTKPPGVYVYDVQRTDSGSETVLSIGSFVILPSVLYP